MLWPTKMPTRMAFSHSRICDLVRSQKVGCSSLIARKHGVSARVANKLWKRRFDRPRSSSKFVRLVGIYILMPPLKNQVASQPCRLQNRASDPRKALQENLSKEKDKDTLLGCGPQKDRNQRGDSIEIIWTWNRLWSVIFGDLNVFCLMIFMR